MRILPQDQIKLCSVNGSLAKKRDLPPRGMHTDPTHSREGQFGNYPHGRLWGGESSLRRQHLRRPFRKGHQLGQEAYRQDSSSAFVDWNDRRDDILDEWQNPHQRHPKARLRSLGMRKAGGGFLARIRNKLCMGRPDPAPYPTELIHGVPSDPLSHRASGCVRLPDQPPYSLE